MKRLFLLEGVVVGGVVVICLLTGRHSLGEITHLLKVVGCLIMLVAGYIIVGQTYAPRRYDYLAPRTARQDALTHERIVRAFRGHTVDEILRAKYQQALVVGGLALVIGWVIDALFT